MTERKPSSPSDGDAFEYDPIRHSLSFSPRVRESIINSAVYRHEHFSESALARHYKRLREDIAAGRPVTHGAFHNAEPRPGYVARCSTMGLMYGRQPRWAKPSHETHVIVGDHDPEPRR